MNIKKRVGYKHDCPKGLIEHTEVGGYIIAVNPLKGIFLCGTGAYNLTEGPIEAVKIMPTSGEKLIADANEPGQLADAFELDPYAVYYILSYGDGSYIFDNIKSACTLGGIIVDYKAHGIIEYLTEKRLQEEI